MTIREQQEINEYKNLSGCASFSDKSRGRDRFEEQCDLRTIYQRDRDRIIHCKAFRRLKQKTQVFLSPEGDHYRTRLTHTLEVAQIARTIARSLNLNEDLVEAIALGHDLGHTPFGHAGERALDEVCSYGFKHNVQSIRIVEKLEKKGAGLNLSWEVRDGILNHQSIGSPSTLEGKVVQLADKIAYINHDIDDAIRGGILEEKDIPEEFTSVLGTSVRNRLNTLIHDIIKNSQETDDIIMSTAVREAMVGLRKFMFEHVYFNPIAKGQEGKAGQMIKQLFYYYAKNPNDMSIEYIDMIADGEEMEVVVCDYISGMTDTYAIYKFREIFEPESWQRV